VVEHHKLVVELRMQVEERRKLLVVGQHRTFVQLELEKERIAEVEQHSHHIVVVGVVVGIAVVEVVVGIAVVEELVGIVVVEELVVDIVVEVLVVEQVGRQPFG